MHNEAGASLQVQIKSKYVNHNLHITKNMLI